MKLADKVVISICMAAGLLTCIAFMCYLLSLVWNVVLAIIFLVLTAVLIYFAVRFEKDMWFKMRTIRPVTNVDEEKLAAWLEVNGYQAYPGTIKLTHTNKKHLVLSGVHLVEDSDEDVVNEIYFGESSFTIDTDQGEVLLEKYKHLTIGDKYLMLWRLDRFGDYRFFYKE
jgi:hypothetical protein